MIARSSVSVIIPTYNRANVLLRCLAKLANQHGRKTVFEILVIDDGSTDDTQRIVEDLGNELPLPIRYYYQGNRGPAAARNLGVKNAKGNIVLFLGDDIIPTSSLIDQHLAWHENLPGNNIAVLGYVTWSPEIRVTPFMYWLENGGPQFAFSEFNPGKIDRNSFYTCNISLKRSFLLQHGLFDEDFPYAAFEDIELGLRLRRQGLEIHYNPDAVAYHYHPMTLASYCRRQRLAGRSLTIFHKKWPGLFDEIEGWASCEKRSTRGLLKRIVVPPLASICSFMDSRGYRLPSRIYSTITDYYSIQGFIEWTQNL